MLGPEPMTYSLPTYATNYSQLYNIWYMLVLEARIYCGVHLHPP